VELELQRVHIAAKAIGMANSFLAGQYAELTSVLYILFAVPTYIVWVYAVGPVMEAMGLGKYVVNIGIAYVPISVVSYLLNGVSGCLDNLLWSADYCTWLIGKERIKWAVSENVGCGVQC
jgi:hypothetical protein